MYSYITDRPILSLPSRYRRLYAVPSSRVGYTLWLNDIQEVLSIQPDGSEAWRPKGTDGGYEQSLVVGTRAIYDYDDLIYPAMYDCVVLS